MLAQRTAWEGPRWTRAVEDQSAPIPEEIMSELEESIRPGQWSFDGHSRNRLIDLHKMGEQKHKLTVDARGWNLSIC